jgi:hypothetical protein
VPGGMPYAGQTVQEASNVYIGPDFIDLIPSFLENREMEIGIISECIARSDMKEAQRLGHGKKGARAAGTVFPR